MKLGIITDIHNNYLALKAVIKRLQQLECDKIICCGDIIGIGPHPEETVQILMQIPNLIAVRGNHEKYLLDKMPTTYPNEERMSPQEMEHHKWEHNLLSAESINFLRKLPYKANLECEGYSISIMHFCMDYDGHYINYIRNPSAVALKNMFAYTNSDIIVYGHDHCRNICKEDKLYINVGSLGCPSKGKNIARAGILKIEKGYVEVEPLDIKYNVDAVVRAIDSIKYPDFDTIKYYFYGIKD